MYFVFVFEEGFGYPKRMHSLNIGMFLRFISLKRSSQFRIIFQISCIFQHLRKKCPMTSTSLQYSHISESFIFILYNHLLHGINQQHIMENCQALHPNGTLIPTEEELFSEDIDQLKITIIKITRIMELIRNCKNT